MSCRWHSTYAENATCLQQMLAIVVIVQKWLSFHIKKAETVVILKKKYNTKIWFKTEEKILKQVIKLKYLGVFIMSM